MALILYATVPLPYAIAGTIVGTVAVWFVSRLCGFGEFSRMQYSMDFLKGRVGRPTMRRGNAGCPGGATPFGSS